MTSVYIDVGLSYSAPHSADWIKHVKDIHVIGFEPNTDLVNSLLTHQIEKQHASHGDPIIFEDVGVKFFPICTALGNEEGNKVFYVTEGDVGCSSIYQPVSGSYSKKTVTMHKLATFLKEIPHVTYLKIDAQGSDLEILKGAGEFLRKVVFVTAEPEDNQYHGTSNSLSAMVDYMTFMGFQQIDHPNTIDPTFINIDFLGDTSYISQFG